MKCAAEFRCSPRLVCRSPFPASGSENAATAELFFFFFLLWQQECRAAVTLEQRQRERERERERSYSGHTAPVLPVAEWLLSIAAPIVRRGRRGE